MSAAKADEVKAGKYELVSLSWDRPLSKPGEPYEFKRYEKGDIVDLDVEEARRLLLSGAVVKPGERERADAEAKVAAARAALALVPEELREKLGADLLEPPKSEQSVAPGGGSTPAPSTGDGAPAGNASTEAWAEYAKSLEIDVPEGASRDDIKQMVAAKQ